MKRSLSSVKSAGTAARGIPDVTVRRRLTTRIEEQTQSSERASPFVRLGAHIYGLARPHAPSAGGEPSVWQS